MSLMRSNYGFSIDGVDCDLFQAAWCRPWMHLTRRGAIFVAPAQPCFIMHELDAVWWPYFDIFLSARALPLLRRVSTYRTPRLWLLWNRTVARRSEWSLLIMVRRCSGWCGSVTLEWTQPHAARASFHARYKQTSIGSLQLQPARHSSSYWRTFRV